MNDHQDLLTYESIDGVTVGTVVGTTMLDGMCVTEFGRQVLDYVQDKKGIQLLLSFANVTYMTSQGLTELLRIHDAVTKLGGSLRLCDVNPQIHRVFEITNLERMFAIHAGEDKDAALHRFARALSVAADEKAWASQDAGG
jgi:stage II sporulation protein AA (anti-sigma F factor antagonist)